MGIPYELSPVEPGVVGMIDSGKPGKLLLLRADMDALPITEDTGLPFASKNEGVMHACGHDVHTSNLLAVARILNETKDQWKGRVKLASHRKSVLPWSRRFWILFPESTNLLYLGRHRRCCFQPQP